MAGDDDDRPRKSWRERDNARNKSSHHGRADERPSRTESSQAYRNYKTQLNNLFDGKGQLPEALREKLDEADVASGAKARKDAAQKIVDAKAARSVIAALEAYKEAYEFPRDEAVLAKLLALDKPRVILDSLVALSSMCDEALLKRNEAWVARVKAAMTTVDHPKVQKAGKELLAKLTA